MSSNRVVEFVRERDTVSDKQAPAHDRVPGADRPASQETLDEISVHAGEGDLIEIPDDDIARCARSQRAQAVFANRGRLPIRPWRSARRPGRSWRLALP